MQGFAAVGIGALVSLMLTANGALASAQGQWPTMIVIHGSGLIAVSILLAALGKRPKLAAGLSPVYYSAGAIGVATVFANNATIASIGVTMTMALGMVGQILASALIDSFGLFGLAKRPFKPAKLLGLCVIVAGIWVMTCGEGS